MKLEKLNCKENFDKTLHFVVKHRDKWIRVHRLKWRNTKEQMHLVEKNIYFKSHSYIQIKSVSLQMSPFLILLDSSLFVSMHLGQLILTFYLESNRQILLFYD
jgi:hypothetical protein